MSEASRIDTDSIPGDQAPGDQLDAAIVGAGFAGLYMLYRLRELGFSAKVYEAGSGVGGTWFWNRYPGARCDIESVDYSYSFSPELEQEWEWSERYPAQPEILRYLNHVADRFDLRRDVLLNTRVDAASFNETRQRWEITTDRRESVSARFLIMATGCLSSIKNPDFPGMAEFRGRTLHTGQWPHEEVDFTGERVGVIGTGSSGIQSIPFLAEQAAELTVFQRTANFSIPAHNRPTDPRERDEVKANYRHRRSEARTSDSGVPFQRTEVSERSALELTVQQRESELEARWQYGGLGFLVTFADTLADPAANEVVAEFVRSKIREAVDDPAAAELLAPQEHPFGTKRPCADTGYYRTFNRDNVTLVDVGESPIEKLTPDGLATGNASYELDSIVFATGFDAMTGALLDIDIRGRANKPLSEKWAEGPRAYLGVATAGFPNLFLITGPGSPSVLSNMIVSIEQHVEWIADCVDSLRRHGLARIEPNRQAEDEWVEHVNEVAYATLYPQANSWYMGANVAGKPRIFMPYIGGVGVYRQKCDEVAANDYDGFTRTP